MTELIEGLRKIYPGLPEDQKPILSEAVNELKNLAEFKAQADNPLPEAPASATVKIVDPATQMEWMFTMRSHSPHALAAELPEMAKVLATKGFIAFDAYVDQRRSERQQNGPQPARQSQPAPPTNGNGNTDSFPAEQLEISINNGKRYFKVKGGRWKQYGVTIWDEVLAEAGFFVDQLDPMQPLNLTGYTAICEMKEDGNPKKVIRLVKQ